MNTPVVVNQEQFKTLAVAIFEEDGWAVGVDTITDPDGEVAVRCSENNAD